MFLIENTDVNFGRISVLNEFFFSFCFVYKAQTKWAAAVIQGLNPLDFTTSIKKKKKSCFVSF